jgi:hypothetical protein
LRDFLDEGGHGVRGAGPHHGELPGGVDALLGGFRIERFGEHGNLILTSGCVPGSGLVTGGCI